MFRGGQGAILVYDVTSRESFQKIEDWLTELETYSTNPDIKKILVGNKCDMVGYLCLIVNSFKRHILFLYSRLFSFILLNIFYQEYKIVLQINQKFVISEAI